MKREKGAVLIEVMVALFITAVVFISVYTTISISLINSNYLKQARETSCVASQLAEAFSACSESEEYSMFDYIKENYNSSYGEVEIDLNEMNAFFRDADIVAGNTANYTKLIDENNLSDYKVQLFLISPNAVYISENSLGTPFGNGIYTPDENLMTFELRVQKRSMDWGNIGYSIYHESQPAVVSYIFHINRG